MGMEGKSFKNYVLGAIFLVISIFFLTKYIGICSLIVGTGGCMIISTALNLKMIKTKLNLGDCVMKYCLILGGIAIPTTMLVNFTFGIIDLYVPKFFALAFCSILGVIVFILLSLVFKVFDVSKITIEIKKRKTFKKEPSLKPLKTMSENSK